MQSDHHHHGHRHEHIHHGHHRSRRRDHLLWALALTLVFAVVELGGGVWARSLALISDAGHMFSDSAALGIALFAQWIARKPVSQRHSYGLARAEVLAAATNSLVMLVVIVLIVIEAVERLRAPAPVSGGSVIVIALAGLLINILVAVMISRGGDSLNERAALMHVMGDLLGSVAALIAGAVIYATGWTPIDPILSMVIACLILYSTLNLLREALQVLMEGVPERIDIDRVGQAIAAIEGIRGVHELHVWNITPEQAALSAHVDLDDLRAWPRTLEAIRIMLHSRFAIDHVTLQPEIPAWLKQPYKADVRIVEKRD